MNIKKGALSSILRSPQTVFSLKDLMLLLGITDAGKAKSLANYYVKRGELYPLRRGLYAKDKGYEHQELGTKIYTPSYISFETVLREAGMIFQYYERIFVASYLAREITADGQVYEFRRLKEEILNNPAGLENKGNYFIASPERAFLDVLYRSKNYYFDNLRRLNWDKCFELVSIYKSKTMEERLRQYYYDYAQS